MTRDPPPKFLYFDLGNVLVHFDHDVMCRNMADAMQSDVEAVARVLFDDGVEQQYETGELTEAEFCARLREATATTARDDVILESHANIFTMNQALLPVLAALRKTGRRMGVLSNTCVSHWRHCCRRFEPVAGFSLAALSFEARCMKPDFPIYQYAAELSETAPSETFFVDDRIENVVAALEFGFDAVPFVSASGLWSDLRDRHLAV